jgi:uncharacterized membrane protein YphA (DoxX/SURF4 family)
MMRILFAGIGWTDIALTLNRIAVGAFFMHSGYHKLFNAERHRTFVDELRSLGVPALGFNQWWVPSVEFSAGAAVLVGLLAPLAALGLLVIILIAIVTSGRQRIKLYKPIDRGDRIDDWLYLPETLYAFMLIIMHRCPDSGPDEKARRVKRSKMTQNGHQSVRCYAPKLH